VTLGELLSVARECKGMSLRDLENVSGVSNALLSQIETGKVKSPGFWTMVAISRALGISLERMSKTDAP
jgi:transcriptional regulator with XRE-family HTH domain